MAFTRACRSLVSVSLPFLFACAAFGQEESGNSTASSRLEMNIYAHGGVDVRIKIFEPEKPAPLAPAIEHLAGCGFDNPKDREIEGDWIFSGRCKGAFRKRGLLVGGQLNFAPLMEILKQANVDRIEVIEPTGDEILVHVLAGNTRLHVALSGRPSLAIEEPISLKPRTGSVHLFDAASGIRLEAV